MMRTIIVGSGIQGRACAFDLLRSPETREVVLCDASASDQASARRFLAVTLRGVLGPWRPHDAEAHRRPPAA